MDGDEKERERQSEAAQAGEKVERIVWHKELFSQYPSEDSSPDDQLHCPQKLRQRQFHRQGYVSSEINLLWLLRQCHEQSMSHAMKHPSEGKAKAACDNETDHWIVGDNCRRSDHEEHGRRIHGTSQNVFIREGPNEIAAALREDVGF